MHNLHKVEWKIFYLGNSFDHEGNEGYAWKEMHAGAPNCKWFNVKTIGYISILQ